MTSGEAFDGSAIGVLALQGAFAEHERAFERLGHRVVQVRTPRDLALAERLVIPGGESTTIGKLLAAYDLVAPIQARARAGMPVWGTCAGLILLARDILEGRPEGQPALALMDLVARRNAFGRQRDSFEATIDVAGLGDFPGVFIRAPLVESVGPGVEVLARLGDGRIVAARQGGMLATAFHPELTGDDRLHALFASWPSREPSAVQASR